MSSSVLDRLAGFAAVVGTSLRDFGRFVLVVGGLMASRREHMIPAMMESSSLTLAKPSGFTDVALALAKLVRFHCDVALAPGSQYSDRFHLAGRLGWYHDH